MTTLLPRTLALASALLVLVLPQYPARHRAGGGA